jgi:hypothetical protein
MISPRYLVGHLQRRRQATTPFNCRPLARLAPSRAVIQRVEATRDVVASGTAVRTTWGGQRPAPHDPTELQGIP